MSSYEYCIRIESTKSTMTDHTDIVNLIIAKTEEPPEWIFKKFDLTHTVYHDDEVNAVFYEDEEEKVDHFVLCLSAKKVLIKCKGIFVCELDISIQAPPRCKAIWVGGTADNTACNLARAASKAHKKAYKNQMDDVEHDIRRFFYEGVYNRLVTGPEGEIELPFRREWVGDQDPTEMCMMQVCDEIGDIVRMYSLGYLKL
jgi:hypothetical protein